MRSPHWRYTASSCSALEAWPAWRYICRKARVEASSRAVRCATVLPVHPAPLPDFGGPGMYGLAPHRAVLAAGLNESAVCVHHVTAEYDQGPLIASRPVPICQNDTPESLQQRATAVEHDLYWRVIAELIAGEAGA